MFKTFFAVIAAACLVALVLTSLGLASILGPAGILLWSVGLVLFGLLVLHRRRAAVVLLALFGASVALSGCGTMANQAAQLAPLVTALAQAGCAGTLHDSIGAQTAAGLSPGAAHVEHTFDGKCEPPPVALTMKDIQSAIAQALAQQQAAQPSGLPAKQ